MGQAFSMVTWYRFGKMHFNRNGWVAASKRYTEGSLDADLSGKVYMVTGANSGIGFELTRYLAKQGATVYMVCRNQDRAQKAKEEVIEECKHDNVHTLIGDCDLQSNVRAVWHQFEEKEKCLNGLILNAGALLDKKVLNAEGVETTFGCHLLNGSYVLTTLALPALKRAEDARVVYVTSGGCYLNKFPNWDTVTSKSSYNGVNSYSIAKRGQVLLAERLAELHPSINFFSCHPGWTDTPGVDAAFSAQKKWLQPLRSTWEGTEGIAWLLVASSNGMENGALYLDREVQPKWLKGKFMPNPNSKADVDTMMTKLEETARQCFEQYCKSV